MRHSSASTVSSREVFCRSRLGPQGVLSRLALSRKCSPASCTSAFSSPESSCRASFKEHRGKTISRVETLSQILQSNQNPQIAAISQTVAQMDKICGLTTEPRAFPADTRKESRDPSAPSPYEQLRLNTSASVVVVATA